MEMVMTNEATATVPVMDTALLDQREAELRDQLKQSIIAGDVDTIYSHQKELRDIPLRRRAADLAQLRKELDDIEARFETNAKSEAGMLGIRQEIDARLQPALDLVLAIGQEKSRAEFATSLIYSERQGLIEERRERRAKIAEHVKTINQEVEKNEY